MKTLEIKNILNIIIRFGITAISTFYLFYIICSIIAAHVNSLSHWLWGGSILLIAALDIIFLVASLFSKPKEIDVRLSTVITCFFCFFAFLISSYIINNSTPTTNLYIKHIGFILNALTYPLTLVALFSLRNRFTILPEAHSIVNSGIYKYLRHPLYFSYILVLISNTLIFNNINVFIINTALIILFVMRAKFEERLLSSNFPNYIDYKKQTPFIPGIKWI